VPFGRSGNFFPTKMFPWGVWSPENPGSSPVHYSFWAWKISVRSLLKSMYEFVHLDLGSVSGLCASILSLESPDPEFKISDS
jgi:hypothetical protein